MADSGGWAALANSTSHLPALGMSMIGLRERNEDRDLTRGLMEQRLGMQEQAAQQAQVTHQAQLANAEAKIPQHQKVMDPGMILQAQVATKKAYGDAGLKAFGPIFETAKEIAGANEKSTFGDVYESVKSAYPAQREQMMETLEKELTSGKLSPVEQQKLQQVYDAVTYDKTGERILGEGIFKNTATSMKMEQENSKSSIVAAQQEGLNARSDERNERIRDVAEENRQLRRDLADKKGSGGGSSDKEEKKDVKTKISEVNSYIRKTSANRAKWLKEYEKDPNSDYGKKMAAEIENFDNQLAIAEDTLAGLQDGSVDPKSVKSGGGEKAQSKSAGAPKVGEVRQGYKFKGGDPADQNSWEKI
jgi:hypothetical protein